MWFCRIVGCPDATRYFGTCPRPPIATLSRRFTSRTVRRTEQVSRLGPGTPGCLCGRARAVWLGAACSSCCRSTARSRKRAFCSRSVCMGRGCLMRTTPAARPDAGCTVVSLGKEHLVSSTGLQTPLASSARMSRSKCQRLQRAPNRQRRRATRLSCIEKPSGHFRGSITGVIRATAQRRQRFLSATSRTTRASGPQTWTSMRNAPPSRRRTSAGISSGLRSHSLPAHTWPWSLCQVGLFTQPSGGVGSSLCQREMVCSATRRKRRLSSRQLRPLDTSRCLVSSTETSGQLI
mmetsp:Transcript_103344/g.186468  ORF Transcript_103344/g.186468 Transcript_103344/m.186468 type:complete len:292 (+) Transcript_103344:166-1041(+)